MYILMVSFRKFDIAIAFNFCNKYFDNEVTVFLPNIYIKFKYIIAVKYDLFQYAYA